MSTPLERLPAAVLAPLEHDPGALRERAADLLSRPPFEAEPPGPIGRALRRVTEWLADLVSALWSAASGGSPLGWALLAVGTAVLLVVVWRATRGLAADRTVHAAPTTTLRRSAVDWHRRADEAERSGDRREAVRLRYGALVATLVEAGVIDDRADRTVGEIDREVEVRRADLSVPVQAAGERFEAAWYGHREPDDHDLATVARCAREVDEGVGGRSRVAVGAVAGGDRP